MKLEDLFPPPRPLGSAPFEYASLVREYAHNQPTRDRCPVECICPKRNGMFVGWPKGRPVGRPKDYFTKAGILFNRDSPVKLGVIAEVMDQLFSHLEPGSIRHPVYGSAIAFFAELVGESWPTETMQWLKALTTTASWTISRRCFMGRISTECDFASRSSGVRSCATIQR